MDDNITVGLYMPSIYKQKVINLGEVRDRVVKSDQFNVEDVTEMDIGIVSPGGDYIVLREDGVIQYFSNVDKITTDKLKSMWNSVIYFIEEFELNIEFDNEFSISIFSKNAPKLYERIKPAINEFVNKILRNWKTTEQYHHNSVFIPIRPKPETINFQKLS